MVESQKQPIEFCTGQISRHASSIDGIGDNALVVESDLETGACIHQYENEKVDSRTGRGVVSNNVIKPGLVPRKSQSFRK